MMSGTEAVIRVILSIIISLLVLWIFSVTALLRRVIRGRTARKNAWQAIEELVQLAPAVPAVPAGLFCAARLEPETISRVPLQGFDSSASIKHGKGEDVLIGADLSQGVFAEISTAPISSGQAKVVNIPVMLRLATQTVIRRAIVFVNGDFALSPRMQYHATSLAQSGIFDEIILMGWDCGNKLSEALRMSGEATPITFYNTGDSARNFKQVHEFLQRRPVNDPTSINKTESGAAGRSTSVLRSRKRGCLISYDHLISKPNPPNFLRLFLRFDKFYALACKIYYILALSLTTLSDIFFLSLFHVNLHGQFVTTSVVFIQSPPAVPILPIFKYILRPFALEYNLLFYYAFLWLASWVSADAKKIIHIHFQPREQERLCSRNSSTKEIGIFRPTIVVDWHNYGYTIPGTLQSSRILLRLYKWLELHCCGDINITVSHAMAHSLLKQVFHDVPEKEGVRMKLRSQDVAPARDPNPERCLIDRSYCVSGSPRNKNRVLVLYDVAPKFFKPSSRAYFVEKVVLPTFNQQAYSTSSAGRPSPNGPTPKVVNAPVSTRGRQYASPDVAKASTQNHRQNLVVPTPECKGTWGIAPPPAWVVNGVVSSNGNGGASRHGPRDNTCVHLHPPSSSSLPLPDSSEEFSQQEQLKKGIIVVASTSWSEDDDYTMLIQALQRLDRRMCNICKFTNTATVQFEAFSDHRSREDNTAMVSMEKFALQTFPGEVQKIHGVDNATRCTSYTFDSKSSSKQRNAPSSLLAFSKLWVIVTGKGPARKRFEDAVRAAHLSDYITVSTFFFNSYNDYSITLGAADVGLCMHFSSSGYDLPMKAVDMIGCGLPVIALGYPAIGELMGQVKSSAGISLAVSETDAIKIEENQHKYDVKGSDGNTLVECERGWIFSSSTDLEMLLSFFTGLSKFQDDSLLESKATGTAVQSKCNCEAKQAKFTPLIEMQRRARVAAVKRVTWEENWNEVLGPTIRSIVP